MHTLTYTHHCAQGHNITMHSLPNIDHWTSCRSNVWHWKWEQPARDFSRGTQAMCPLTCRLADTGSHCWPQYFIPSSKGEGCLRWQAHPGSWRLQWNRWGRRNCSPLRHSRRPSLRNVLCSHSSSIGARASTNDTRYVCTDWMSRISIKRMKLIARQFYLSGAIRQPRPGEIPHLPPFGMMAFFEAIMRGWASLPLHPFLIAVLEYFNVAPFQFTPNSFRIMVAFYIAFMESDIGEPFVVEFA